MKITACVCYPVYVQIEIADTASEDEKIESLFQEADRMFETSSISPVIHDCSDKSLEDPSLMVMSNEFMTSLRGILP